MIATFFALLSITCSGNISSFNLAKKDIVFTQNRSISLQLSKKKMLQELQNLKIAFKAKDKKGISKFFKFPLDDSTISVYGIDSKIDLEVQDNHGRLGEKTFEKHFNRIYEYFEMEEFNKLFQNLNTDSLLKKNNIKSEKHYKNKGCYHTYKASIEGNQIILTNASNSDEEYLEKHPNESMACAEHTSSWIFTFDGQNLYFKKLIEAG